MENEENLIMEEMIKTMNQINLISEYYLLSHSLLRKFNH